MHASCCVGAVLANLMFALPAISIATSARSGAGLWLGEVVATLGLPLVIFGTVRTGRSDRVAFSGYITAAYWFTSSTSFANPAVTIARMFSDTFAGIAPGSVPMFLVMQLAGAGVGYLADPVPLSPPRDTAADLASTGTDHPPYPSRPTEENQP